MDRCPHCSFHPESASDFCEQHRPAAYKLNTARDTAVATDYYWLAMTTCPIGVKVQLLNAGEVAVYGIYRKGDDQWLGWAPLPKRGTLIGA